MFNHISIFFTPFLLKSWTHIYYIKNKFILPNEKKYTKGQTNWTEK